MPERMLSLGTIFRSLLLFVNALAILHEKRFLVRWGLSESMGLQQSAGVRLQVINLLKAFRVLRAPIMVVNMVTVVALLLLG